VPVASRYDDWRKGCRNGALPDYQSRQEVRTKSSKVGKRNKQ
jgi:hypothetical protein